MLTVSDIAKKCNVSGATVRKWIRAGLLRAIYLPGNGERKALRVERDDFAAFFSSWDSSQNSKNSENNEVEGCSDSE